MPGQEPKAHHFVHRAYLEGFQDPSREKLGAPSLWVYIPGKSPFPQRPARVAKRNYYYCLPEGEGRNFEVEHALQKLEDAALPALRHLRVGKFDLIPDDRLTFAGYVAMSCVRVPIFEKWINRFTLLQEAKRLEFITHNRKALEWLARKFEEETGEHTDPEDLRRKLTGGNVVLSQSNRGWTIRNMFEFTMNLQELIFNMNWTFLIAREDDGFLTSDNPVAVHDPIQRSGNAGFTSSREAFFLFPLSKHVCLRGAHTSGPSSSELDAASVRAVNKAIIERVDSQLYAPFRSEAVQRLLNFVATNSVRPRRVLLRRGRVTEE
jgi:hypothetical protein